MRRFWSLSTIVPRYLTSEIIGWKLRLFVPMGANGPDILTAMMERYPLVRISDRGTA